MKKKKKLLYGKLGDVFWNERSTFYVSYRRLVSNFRGAANWQLVSNRFRLHAMYIGIILVYISTRKGREQLLRGYFGGLVRKVTRRDYPKAKAPSKNISVCIYT